MKNCLVFVDSNTSMALIPDYSVRSIHATGATTVKIQYEGDDVAAGSAIINVTSGKQDEVIKELARLLSTHTGVITVADDVNSVYEVPNVVSCGTINISG